MPRSSPLMAASLSRLAPVCCIVGVLGAVPVAAADDGAHEAIERMNRALRDLSYEGEFVFHQRGRLESMRITHRVRDGEEFEHLIVLNGEKREVIRDRNAVTCLVPGQNARKLDRRLSGRGFSPLLPLNTSQLEKHYRFKLTGMSRIAGRATRIVEIAPRDELRFGYQLHLDTETALPLRSRMLDEDGETLSELLFTSLRLLPAGGPDPALPDIAAAGSVAPKPADADLLQALQPPEWQFTTVPSGFMLNVHRRRSMDYAQGPMEHFVFSDGLATVSVYIEALAQNAFEGVSTVGTLNALGRRIGDHQVTVVGEVPLKTLQQLASAIEPAGKAQ